MMFDTVWRTAWGHGALREAAVAVFLLVLFAAVVALIYESQRPK